MMTAWQDTVKHDAAAPSGSPCDPQLDRMAERRAFVEIKKIFIDAARDLEGSAGDTLQQQVRAATEPAQLWQLQTTLVALLAKQSEAKGANPSTSRRSFDLTTPDSAWFQLLAGEPQPISDRAQHHSSGPR